MAKAPHENRSDGEGRKLGEQSGLDIGIFELKIRVSLIAIILLVKFKEYQKFRLITRVVLAVNAAS